MEEMREIYDETGRLIGWCQETKSVWGSGEGIHYVIVGAIWEEGEER